MDNETDIFTCKGCGARTLIDPRARGMVWRTDHRSEYRWDCGQCGGVMRAPVRAVELALAVNAASRTPGSNTRSTVLQDAAALVNGDRQADYGSPRQNFGRIARLWSAYLDAEVTAPQVAHMMALVKLARLRHSPGHRDSSVDLCGYAALGAELAGGGE